MVPRAVGFTIVWPEGVIFGSSVTNGLLSSRDATVIETLRTVVAANPKMPEFTDGQSLHPGSGLVKQVNRENIGPSMKKRSLRYAGDKAVRALLERYACPTSFHVIRTRLLGNIATPRLDASPLRAIESCWEGELPGFDNVGAASELFESLMGLWNELARHQSATKPFRLTRMEAKPDTDDIRRLCRTRTEELEGFIDGLFGDVELMDLPERANEALDNLGKIYAMTRVIIDLLERESASERDLRGILKDVGELSHIAEKELHAVMLACKRARQQTLSTIAVGKPTVH